MHKTSRTPTACYALFACVFASACVEGHALPGTREGLFVDGGDDGEPGDGDGDGDGDMPDAAPPEPTCNPTACAGASNILFGETPGCCTVGDRCGLDFSALGLNECLERDAPGPVDSACPEANVFGLIMFPGCCARDGMCGLLVDSFLPLGCVSGEIEIPIPGLGGGPPMSCSNAPE